MEQILDSECLKKEGGSKTAGLYVAMIVLAHFFTIKLHKIDLVKFYMPPLAQKYWNKLLRQQIDFGIVRKKYFSNILLHFK